ncbi:MAG: 16S rRNA (guanine(527)-N(7))-methyltransferase RsmG [Acidobacteriaceae bacterium]
MRAGVDLLPVTAFEQFSKYLELLLVWNQRLSLTAVREPDQIVRRHFLECAVAAQNLPHGVASLLDYGSGAGFPGIPVLICRPEIEVTLAESQGKKAAFLREATRVLHLPAEVYAGRVEAMPDSREFDVVAMRAVDKMEEAVVRAEGRARKYLFLLTTRKQAQRLPALVARMSWEEPITLPDSEDRVVAIGRRVLQSG